MRKQLRQHAVKLSLLALAAAALLVSSRSASAVETSPLTPKAAVADANASPAVESVVERFRLYNGKRTPKAMMELLGPREPGRFHQQPLAALSDGVTPVLLTIKVDTSDGKAPNFSSSGARFISAKRDEKGNWIIEVIPDAGSLQASVTVMTHGQVTELPLAVAPPLPAGTDLGTAAFTAFLEGSGSNRRPLRDLNGDNIPDYRDDYIFTVNYLVKELSDPHNLINRQRKALEMTPKR